MINIDLKQRIKQNFFFQPTKAQEEALDAMCSFWTSHESQSLFLLRGYAGTGKTTLISAFVRTCREVGQKFVLMAPTGRAAKVFSLNAAQKAYTIHKRIYRQKVFNGTDENFAQQVNLAQNTLFLVDEASMIANDSGGGTFFGSGRLLDDLIRFVYSGKGCRLVLIGDNAQLPPVGQLQSPALESDVLQGYGLDVTACELTDVVRQTEDSGILWNATMLREHLAQHLGDPVLRVSCFSDVCRLPGDELIETLEQAYYHSGLDQTIVITRSNKRANVYNQGIRSRILGRDEMLCGGDWILIAKNNYHWLDDETKKMMGSDFIANGDLAVVRKIRNERVLYGMRFADVCIQFPDYEDLEVDATVLLDTLMTDAPSLTKEQQEHLFQEIWNDYPEINVKKERMMKLKNDSYFNALQIKYAYALTCHKAQGGQWETVFIDQGYLPDELRLTEDYQRWLYTALTRATKRVYLVNWPEVQLS